MSKPKLFPGFPKGDNGVLRVGVLETSKKFSNGTGTKTKQICTILNVLADGMQNEGIYQTVHQKINANYAELSRWWNQEMFQKRGGQMGTGQLIMTDVSSDGEADEATKGIDPNGFYLLQMQLLATKSDGPMARMSTHPEFAEQLNIFNQMLWTIHIAVFKPGELDRLATIFRNSSGRNWS
jgi:hypothetical protein